DQRNPQPFENPENRNPLRLFTAWTLFTAWAQLTFQRARTEGKEAPTCGGARGSGALASLEDRCRVSDVDWGRRPRRGPLFGRAPLFQLPQGGAPASRGRRLTRWSNTVCAALREPGPMSPSRVAETLANGLA